MEYIRRELERKFLEASQAFKAVMVVGARQVGKSTMLKQLAKDQKRTYVTMDDTQLRQFAQTDPKLFLQTYQPPILIDEVQKAPELFERIKIICDENEERGLFWLTGSQSRKLMKKAGDSLAGRLCVLKMYSLSQHELLGIYPDDGIDFSYPAWSARKQLFPANNVLDTFERIWRGGMPDVQPLNQEMMQEYFSSYIETYLMRDAVDDNGITDTEGFRKFLRACAAFAGQLLNYNDLAPFDPDRPELPWEVCEQVELQIKYEGYIEKQLAQIEQMRKMESKKLPPDMDYSQIYGLRLEAIEKLNKIKPLSLGQASRISGVSPADISMLAVWLMHEKGVSDDT